MLMMEGSFRAQFRFQRVWLMFCWFVYFCLRESGGVDPYDNFKLVVSQNRGPQYRPNNRTFFTILLLPQKVVEETRMHVLRVQRYPHFPFRSPLSASNMMVGRSRNGEVEKEFWNS